jgi:hypothetical protein
MTPTLEDCRLAHASGVSHQDAGVLCEGRAWIPIDEMCLAIGADLQGHVQIEQTPRSTLKDDGREKGVTVVGPKQVVLEAVRENDILETATQVMPLFRRGQFWFQPCLCDRGHEWRDEREGTPKRIEVSQLALRQPKQDGFAINERLL